MLGTTFALLALVVVAGGILVASAYSRAEGIARQLQQIQGELTRARHALAHGQLPQGDPFNAASGLVADAQVSIQRGGLPFRCRLEMGADSGLTGSGGNAA